MYRIDLQANNSLYMASIETKDLSSKLQQYVGWKNFKLVKLYAIFLKVVWYHFQINKIRAKRH